MAYEFSAVFHNSLLPTIAPRAQVAGLSGLGLALGNAAGVVLLLFMLFAFALPGVVPWSFIPAHPLFGISQALHEPERLSGPICAVWLIVFSIPLFFFTPDRPSSNMPLFQAMMAGVRSVIRTIRSLKHYRNVGAYLLARLFFNDGMTAVLVFGGIYASSTFHWGPIPMLIYGIELEHLRGARRISGRLARQSSGLEERDLRERRRHDDLRPALADHGAGPDFLVHSL